MKLEEAINHCEKTALSCAKSNRDCALEHVQLMQWLKELRVLRQLVEPEYLQEVHGLQKTWGKEWEEYFNRALRYDVTGPFRDRWKKHSVIEQATKQGSIEFLGFEKCDYTIPFRHGAEWAIKYCNQVIRKVLEHYEPCSVIDCIMADYEEIISTETEVREHTDD